MLDLPKDLIPIPPISAMPQTSNHSLAGPSSNGPDQLTMAVERNKTITLDTNVLYRYWNPQDQQKFSVVKELLKLSDLGYLDLAVTTRISADIFKPPLSKRINELPSLGIHQIGSIIRWDCSKWGSDVWGGGELFSRFFGVINSIDYKLDQKGVKWKRPDFRDWDHLFGHYRMRRNIFLTWDAPILSFASDLQAKLEIQIMKPEEFLTSLTKYQSRTNKTNE